MRRIAVVLFIALAATGVLSAQEIVVSGELKTGFYTEQETIGSLDPVAKGGMTNNDGDSGSHEGRLRLDFLFAYQSVGVKVRFQIEPEGMESFLPIWNYAYVYGNLFNEQLTISAGILGNSPWGTGGPRLRSDPESREYMSYNDLSGDPYIANEGLMGIRFEYKPSFLPGFNIGFVLNQPDQVAVDINEQSFGDVLGESVIGAAYEHEYFAVRVGYRFDSDADHYKNNKNEGGRLTYRLEERVLDRLAEGMKIWLNGVYNGIGSEQFDMPTGAGNVKVGSCEYFINWLYWLWDTDNFTAKLDVGLGMYQAYHFTELRPEKRQEYQSLEVFPGFYYKFFDNLLQIGLGLGFGVEFGNGKTYKKSDYQYFSVEPQIRLNLGSGAYVAALYTYTDKYTWWNKDAMPSIPDGVKEGDKSVKHAINIRAVYAF
jgi:hypothetical protein